MNPAVPKFATGFNNYVPPLQQAALAQRYQQPVVPYKPKPKLIPQQATQQNPPMLQQTLQTYQNVPIQQQNSNSPLLPPPFKNPQFNHEQSIPMQQAPSVQQAPLMKQAPQVVKGPLMQQAPTAQQNQQAGFPAQQSDRKI